MYVAFCSVMMPVPNKLCLTAMPVMSVAHMRSCLELMAAMVFCPSLMCSRFEKTLTYGNSIDKMDAKGSSYKAAAGNRPVDEQQFIPSIAGIFLAKKSNSHRLLSMATKQEVHTSDCIFFLSQWF